METTKINKKRPGSAHFFLKKECGFTCQWDPVVVVRERRQDGDFRLTFRSKVTSVRDVVNAVVVVKDDVVSVARKYDSVCRGAILAVAFRHKI